MIGNPLTVRGALFAAGLILLVSLGMKLGVGAGLVGDDLSQRVVGVMLGALLVGAGSLTSVAGSGLSRLARWTFVLAGLASVITWLAWPVESASLVATAIAAGAVFVVATAAGWGWRAREAERRASEPDE